MKIHTLIYKYKALQSDFFIKNEGISFFDSGCIFAVLQQQFLLVLQQKIRLITVQLSLAGAWLNLAITNLFIEKHTTPEYGGHEKCIEC